MTDNLDPREYHLLEAHSWHQDAQWLDREAFNRLVDGELLGSLRSVGQALFCDAMWAYHRTMAFLEAP
jgi:hypothetical protein